MKIKFKLSSIICHKLDENKKRFMVKEVRISNNNMITYGVSNAEAKMYWFDENEIELSNNEEKPVGFKVEF